MTVISFWSKWDKLDELKQVKHIKYIAEMLDNLRIFKTKKERIDAMAGLLNSYFEDCVYYGQFRKSVNQHKEDKNYGKE